MANQCFGTGLFEPYSGYPGRVLLFKPFPGYPGFVLSVFKPFPGYLGFVLSVFKPFPGYPGFVLSLFKPFSGYPGCVLLFKPFSGYPGCGPSIWMLLKRYRECVAIRKTTVTLSHLDCHLLIHYAKSILGLIHVLLHLSCNTKTFAMRSIVVLALFGAAFGFPADFEEAIPVAEPEPGVNWAVLIAGSTGWGNYRHQADVCHAYQILHRNGIPDERIVVMMADDLAHNIRNPTKGIIINHPDGKDVYHGVPKDYTRFDVTAKNFLRVLKGDREGVAGIGSGKVIESGPHDNVFVYYTDHGAPGIVAMPHGGMLHADDLVTTLKEMHQENKFNKLVFYLESCESGSMFDKMLPDNINSELFPLFSPN
uniref:Legumain n=1 Tax=Branchiostoma floridae TaxID=7739 RepID=C3Z936_BRAFL|eukprot:XP_002594937.1 hypothetical protein BRAFLDRAFT_130503 [Branchiostoma floridae]